MTWNFHPIVRLDNREVTFDLVGFQIYLCLAVGHLVHQVNAFDPAHFGDLAICLYNLDSFNFGRQSSSTEDE